jgi:hypothetical protein
MPIASSTSVDHSVAPRVRRRHDRWSRAFRDFSTHGVRRARMTMALNQRKDGDMTTETLIARPADRLDEYRVRARAVRFLTIPRHRFAMLDGSGPPESGALAARIPALFTMAYGLHFVLKKRDVQAKVTPLEGLWWQDGSTDLSDILAEDRSNWRWTLMIGLPDAATDEEIDEQLGVARTKIDRDIAESLRTEWFDEGDAAQVLHVGPYAEERPSIERLHAAIHEAGFELSGWHHEIYVGDPRRSAPERLKTVIRQPIARRAQ